MEKIVLTVAAVAALLLGLAQTGLADAGYGKMLPTKDWGSGCPEGHLCFNTGGCQYVVVKAFCLNWVADFDRTDLDDTLDAWPDHEVRLYIKALGIQGNDPANSVFNVATFFTQSQWNEGDGVVPPDDPACFDFNCGNDYTFNWTKGLKGACKWYAQTAYTDGDGVPNTGDEVLDTANCQDWLLADGSPAAHPWAAGTKPGDTHFEGIQFSGRVDQAGQGWRPNSVHIEPTGTDVWAHTTLDDALLADLRGDGLAHCGGIRVGLSTKADHNDLDDWSNCQMWTREADADHQPHLRLMYLGDATQDGKVDGADYTAWADNYGKTGMTWGTGDFTGEGDVDGADYTAWADHYGDNPGGVGSVPEPATMALLALGGIALIRRRR